ncbi:MAG TPA: bifunctional diaminohydroxyphosphoribosylaminopyrimidine deaminase/5-amino-6-(5-phosphoribosylamino)uracil reductase RibD [Chitinophagaceae bacterium]|nr:bifunctional diaminohydroxyphosphoribosylaminopyrimidine deaminase/5-amino-6-(5-phosphoribosylamino)uracil reductase RibD [Chitinophagaceae bacterium]
MTEHDRYMERCLALARLGEGAVAPNPMVGAVLVQDGRIIGEGYHAQYGGPHAEVHCFDSVRPEHRALIPESTLYVSLEPCAHFGKTPPCADRILREGVRSVVVGCRDPFPQVNGKGIEKLEAAGITVKTGVQEAACLSLNRRFFLFHTKHRPYIVLKWARSADHRMAGAGTARVMISRPQANRIVHRWRAQEMSILVGTNTALYDNPELTVRHWPGRQPIRLVIDRNRRLPPSLKLFSGEAPTIFFTNEVHTIEDLKAVPQRDFSAAFYQITGSEDLVPQVVHALYQMGIQSVLVEGGARLLQSFIDADLWDEARVITNESLHLGAGLPAPELTAARLVRTLEHGGDSIRYFVPSSTAGDPIFFE